jgi:uncharacterized cofD-like protein
MTFSLSTRPSTAATIRMVAIGGGTGLATLLEGLKRHVNGAAPLIELTAIVTVTDDGRSSGRLRREFEVPPPGDLRNCLVALAPEENRLTALFRHRFPGEGPLGGHALGNLILLGLMQQEGDLRQAVEIARRMLGIRARVLPSTLTPVDLVARIGRRKVRGQVAIKSQEGPIETLELEPAGAPALPEAISAIEGADLITLGPGSLFTSVIANLLVGEIAAALVRSTARKIYICNAMTEYDETDRLDAADHLRQLLASTPGLTLDDALFNSAPISGEMRERYAAERARALPPPAGIPADLAGIRFHALPLASESRFVRHDPERLSRAILALAGVRQSVTDAL